MPVHKRYSFDTSEYGLDIPRGRAICTANEDESEWVCELEVNIDSDELSKQEWRDLQAEIRQSFETDLRREYGVKKFYWKGDRRSPLLRFQKGDHVKFRGGEGEVVYIVPEQAVGVKTPDGKVLNFNVKTLDHFLFKKVKPPV